MFAQDLSIYNWKPTLLMRGEIRSIGYHKSSIFILQSSIPASPGWVEIHMRANGIGIEQGTGIQ
jgi:hypothetical protein